MLTIDEREIAGPGTGAHPTGGRSSFRRMSLGEPCYSLKTAGVVRQDAVRL